MTTDERMANLYYCLGIVAGSLINPNTRAKLLEALQLEDLDPEYVRLIRDGLTQVLDLVRKRR